MKKLLVFNQVTVELVRKNPYFMFQFSLIDKKELAATEDLELSLSKKS